MPGALAFPSGVSPRSKANCISSTSFSRKSGRISLAKLGISPPLARGSGCSPPTPAETLLDARGAFGLVGRLASDAHACLGEQAGVDAAQGGRRSRERDSRA